MALRFLLLLLTIAFELAAAGPLAPRATAGDDPDSAARYGPPEPADSVQTGTASYYADTFEGRPTASGERFVQGECTAAHRTLPFGSVLRVVNLENQREVLVRVNDRGPFTKARLVDLSRSAAEELGMVSSGTATVRIEVLRRGD